MPRLDRRVRNCGRDRRRDPRRDVERARAPRRRGRPDPPRRARRPSFRRGDKQRLSAACAAGARRRQLDRSLRRRRGLQADPHDTAPRRVEPGLGRMPPPPRGDAYALPARRHLRRSGAGVPRQLGLRGLRVPARCRRAPRFRADGRRARDQRQLDRAVRARVRHRLGARAPRAGRAARVEGRARRGHDGRVHGAPVQVAAVVPAQRLSERDLPARRRRVRRAPSWSISSRGSARRWARTATITSPASRCVPTACTSATPPPAFSRPGSSRRRNVTACSEACASTGPRCARSPSTRLAERVIRRDAPRRATASSSAGTAVRRSCTRTTRRSS